jgi:hypothetical protein
MASSLIKIDEEIVTSAVASVTLTGIDSTYDVYMVKINKLECDTNNRDVWLRFTTSGTADTSSNYDNANKELRADSAFSNRSGTNLSVIQIGGNIGDQTGEQFNAVLYLFNFNNASEYSFCTFETSHLDSGPNHRGRQGGGVLTVAQATDGINVLMAGGNIDNGTFTLYGLAK